MKSNVELFEKMIYIRLFEELIAKKCLDGYIKTPIHLYCGQEAVALSVFSVYKKGDLSFWNHRSHGHYLALGGDPVGLIAEILGKSIGSSGGHGGSMHIKSESDGFLGAIPIVAGTISIALGSSFYIKNIIKNDNIVFSFF